MHYIYATDVKYRTSLTFNKLITIGSNQQCNRKRIINAS